MTLFEILEMLKTAPDSQMDEYWLKRCTEFSGTEEELMTLFEELYNTNDIQTSKFIRTLVDPQYTRKYMSDHKEETKND